MLKIKTFFNNLYKAFKVVLWSFFGVRKHAKHQQDVKLNIIHIIIVAIILTVSFIYVLLKIVNYAIVNYTIK